MNFEEWAEEYFEKTGTDFRHDWNMKNAWSAALEEAAKLSKEPLDNPTEEEIAQMAQGTTISEIKANRILKLIEL